MRKMLAVLFAFMAMLGAGAFAEETGEILFRGIPWGSGIDEVKESLIDSGCTLEEMSVSEWFMLSDFGRGIIDHDDGYCYTYKSGYELDVKPTRLIVAGYKVSKMEILFMCYPENGIVSMSADKAALVQASIQLDIGNFSQNEVYEDIANKLIQVYGDKAAEYRHEEDSIRIPYAITDGAMWIGANHTAVSASREWHTKDGVHEVAPVYGFSHELVYLKYGLTNLDNYIDQINDYYERLEKEAEERERQSIQSNIDGL